MMTHSHLLDSLPMSTRLAVIGGDGIGPEVVAAGLEVLDAVVSRDGGFALQVDHLDWGRTATGAPAR